MGIKEKFLKESLCTIGCDGWNCSSYFDIIRKNDHEDFQDSNPNMFEHLNHYHQLATSDLLLHKTMKSLCVQLNIIMSLLFAIAYNTSLINLPPGRQKKLNMFIICNYRKHCLVSLLLFPPLNILFILTDMVFQRQYEILLAISGKVDKASILHKLISKEHCEINTGRIKYKELSFTLIV